MLTPRAGESKVRCPLDGLKKEKNLVQVSVVPNSATHAHIRLMDKMIESGLNGMTDITYDRIRRSVPLNILELLLRPTASPVLVVLPWALQSE